MYCLPPEHDQIVTSSAPWSTSTTVSSLRRPVCDDLCLPLGLYTCDVACPLPLQLGCFNSNISHLSNGAQDGVSEG